MKLFSIKDETAPLESVIVGVADDIGPPPSLEEAYDPKSRMHIEQGTYPKEADMILEINQFAQALQDNGIRVFRPQNIPNCNQIFTRDIGFVIDNTFVSANILPRREKEFGAIKDILNSFDSSKIISPPIEVHVEGGDVMPVGPYLFVGTYLGADYSEYITARTNKAAVDWLAKIFPQREVKPFELKKSNTDPYSNALHLDCCFQPVGTSYALIHPEGFVHQQDVRWLKDYYGEENLFEIDSVEMYEMFSNIFSISPKQVVSDRSFKRLNDWLRLRDIEVIEISYREIAKQEGLLRCSTLPLTRTYAE